MAEREKWQWQEPGKAWKGAGLYHITLTVTDRQPVLGRLAMPEGDPARAFVARTALGDALVDCLKSIPQHHTEVQVLHFCLMPDHLHAVLYVRRKMEKGIASVVRGFWQAAKKLGRACTATGDSFIIPNDIREELKEGSRQLNDIREELKEGSRQQNDIREELKEGSRRLEDIAATLREQMGDEAYYRLAPVFTEMPFIRPMVRYSQLPNTIRYLDMNPQRLATKRLRPGLFRVQKDIAIGDRKYDGVGNVALLMREQYAPVHVRRTMVEQAQQGCAEPLRQYKNGCVLKAREGTVMVSPFISQDEKQVMAVLLQERHPFVLLTDNGFHDYYKPADLLFDACAEGRLLILSPWPYDGGKRRISRADCVALNTMAEEICTNL
ncbi:MAG: hypothetical protein IJ762_04525 [Bacteroidaceae bacterium]|nr:hypothetical protein [Bacteroidaceae bacterium]MBR1788440.1 hypothetical protein [Bacteroidaceae bacterium]